MLPLEQLDLYKEPGYSTALLKAENWFDRHLAKSDNPPPGFADSEPRAL